MPRLLRIFILLSVVVCGFAAAEARVVNSREDLERLRGWDAHQNSKVRAERERLQKVDEVEKAREAFAAKQAKSLVEYREWKSRQKAALDESSPEYKKDLQRKVEAWVAQDKKREEFIERRNRERKLGQSEIALTEEEELGIDKDAPRVDWDQRNHLADKKPGASASSSGGSFSRPSTPSFNGGGGGGGSSNRPDYIPPEFDSPPPPPPVAPPAEFFEPQEGGGDGMDIPPPPPVDEGGAPPPPVFDDDF